MHSHDDEGEHSPGGVAGPGGAELVLVSVGNSRIKFAPATGVELGESRAVGVGEARAGVEQILKMTGDRPGASVVIASVNPAVADEVEEGLLPVLETVYRVGRDLHVPINIALDDPATVGQDRLINALGAFRRARQACVVIDVGTALTVDFVDGVGTFQGGVIAPGPRMMLAALHERTAALPAVAFATPDAARGVFGKDTAHAMLLGACESVRGLAHLMVNRYAEAYGAYPRVIATGGDARSIFENDEVVEHVVPDLQLIGLAEVCAIALADADDDGT